MFQMEGVVYSMRKIRVILVTLLLFASAFFITNLHSYNEIVRADGFPRDIFIEIHRIMELDEVDPGSGADWYFYVGVDEGSGHDWKRSSIPYKDNLNHLIINKVFNFMVSTSPVLVAIRLCEDDFWGDDLADISSYPGEGRDDSTGYRRGATCIVSYDLDTHSWTGDVDGSTSTGYSETNGEWDGSSGTDTNDAALWFMIWDDTRVDIKSPLLCVPLIQVKSESFDIQIELDSVNPPILWNAAIYTEYDSYDLQINNIVQVDTNNWVLNAQVPQEARVDMYDLKVEVDGVWDIEPHALSLVDTFSFDFKFIQITDPHIDDPSAEFGGGLGDSLVEANILSSVIKEINLIHPDFVIASGDIGDNPEGIGQNEVRQYERVKNILLELQVPVYVLNGNHDYDSDMDEGSASIKEYKDIINPYLDFSWDFGSYHFVGLDSGENAAYYGLPDGMKGKGLTNNQINWLQTDLDAHEDSELTFIFMHHTVFDPDGCPEWPHYNSSISQNQKNFLNICKQNGVSMVLTGHTHIDEVWDREGNKQTGNTIGNPVTPLYIQTKSVTHDDNHNEHGYRLIRCSGGTLSDYTYDRDGNGQRDADSSIVAGKLEVDFAPGNDGSSEIVKATIENDLHEDFNNARMVFKMPKPQPGLEYIAINGWIEQKIECPTYDIYYVRTDISERSTKEVILQPGYLMDLKEGWNLISIPLIQTKTDLETVLRSIEGLYDTVEWFDANGNLDQWKVYDKNKPSQLMDLHDLDHTMGFWIHVTQPNGVILQVTGIQPIQNQLIALHPGWNLVGYPSLSNNNRDTALNNINFQTDVDAVWTFDANTQKWEIVGESDYLETGRGYWIHSKVAKIWEVPL